MTSEEGKSHSKSLEELWEEIHKQRGYEFIDNEEDDDEYLNE